MSPVQRARHVIWDGSLAGHRSGSFAFSGVVRRWLRAGCAFLYAVLMDEAARPPVRRGMLFPDRPLVSMRPCAPWAGRFTFTAGVVAIRLADGRCYRGAMRLRWGVANRWVGFVSSPAAVRLEARLNADGAEPPGLSVKRLWPMQVALGVDTLGVCRGAVWLPRADGAMAGEILTLVARYGGPEVWKGVAVRP